MPERVLISSPVSSYSGFNKHFILDTDASVSPLVESYLRKLMAAHKCLLMSYDNRSLKANGTILRPEMNYWRLFMLESFSSALENFQQPINQKGVTGKCCRETVAFGHNQIITSYVIGILKRGLCVPPVRGNWMFNQMYYSWLSSYVNKGVLNVSSTILYF